jgi:hypothetical protein
VEVRFKNLNLDLLQKEFGMNLWGIIKYIRSFYSQNSKKKGHVLLKLWAFEDFVSDTGFWSYFVCFSIFGSIALGSYKS